MVLLIKKNTSIFVLFFWAMSFKVIILYLKFSQYDCSPFKKIMLLLDHAANRTFDRPYP